MGILALHGKRRQKHGANAGREIGAVDVESEPDGAAVG